MKKKFFCFTFCFAFIVVCAACIAACKGESNEITDVSLHYTDESLYFDGRDTGDKQKSYSVTIQYGTKIDLEKIEVSYVRDNGAESFKANKKTESEDGYTLESTLPAEQTVGNYTLTYAYAGWTNVVNVTIEQKRVALPHFEGDSSYVTYDGKDYTSRIIYDKNAVEMLSPNVQRIKPLNTTDGNYDYTVTFGLKNKLNYCWDAVFNGNDDSNTDDYDFGFSISKKVFEIDVNEFVNYDKNDSHVTPPVSDDDGDGSYAKHAIFNYSVNEDYPKTISLNMDKIADFKDFVEVKLYKNDIGGEVAEKINGEGYYYLVVELKNDVDSDCYGVHTATIFGTPGSSALIAEIRVS